MTIEQNWWDVPSAEELKTRIGKLSSEQLDALAQMLRDLGLAL